MVHVANQRLFAGCIFLAHAASLRQTFHFARLQFREFLHSFPASSVQRASPPSPTARPFSRELPVDPYCDHRWDFPCCAWSPLRTCRRQYPGRSDGTCSLVQFHSLRPSHELWAGRLLHHYFRGLLSVHSRYSLHTRRVALAPLCTRCFTRPVAFPADSIATV